ncbi:hypothetical protein [Salirhabdus salicampi]|uniref:hypothetical protein n=1 Tax=Salirhabdus salicampi TaxID=476102 RepID=UPI0020C2B57B|nr:hypothetical protein [Salirhabdus salicampi]MCP8615402.1 hypothetical protein [Salirhabdus salicampi]
MKYKKRILVISFTLVVLSIVFSSMTPDENDFGIWLNENYDVHCWDMKCDVFDIEIEENGEVRTMTLQANQVTYTPGIFVMKKRVLYSNIENFDYRLDVKVYGSLGKIYLKEEEKTF